MTIGHGLGLRWPEPLRFSLAFAAIVGGLYALRLLGPTPLNPANTQWISSDPASYYIAWELYRQDPNVHWPLTFTGRIGYPQGASIALADANPLLALLFKPLSPILPRPFQYLGIEAVLSLVLQVFFAVRLFRLLCGPHPVPILLGAGFVLIAPPLTYRLGGHYALANHWLILAALLLVLESQLNSGFGVRRYFAYSALVAAVSVGTNPYLAFQVLMVLAAGVASLLWRRRLSASGALAGAVAIAAAALVTLLALGFFIPGGAGYGAGGYRSLSMNLLAPFDPQGFGSLFLPRLPQLTGEQYEGYSYLGAGFLLVAAVVVPLSFQRRKRLGLRREVAVPLAAAGALLTLFALSTRISAGRIVMLDLDPHQRLTPLFAILRASGRLFWAPYYLIVAAVIATAFAILSRRSAAVLLTVGLAIQALDTMPVRRWTHAQVNRRDSAALHSPVWTKLGSAYRNLMVVPPWQCGGDSPGGGPGYRIFGMLAIDQHMRTNSYYAGRYSPAAIGFQCTTLEARTGSGILARDSVYVVSPAVAARVEASPAGPDACHDLDGFILCAVGSDFGLPRALNSRERVAFLLHNAGFETELFPWIADPGARAEVTPERSREGSHSLAEFAGSVYQDVGGLNNGQDYLASAWVSGENAHAASAQLELYDAERQTSSFSDAVAPGAAWIEVSKPFRAGATGTIRIRLRHAGGAGAVFWDDVRISMTQ